MALVYDGMADPFVFGGKEYHPGDRVPISKAQALDMASRTALHRWKDSDDEPVLPPAAPIQPTTSNLQPPSPPTS